MLIIDIFIDIRFIQFIPRFISIKKMWPARSKFKKMDTLWNHYYKSQILCVESFLDLKMFPSFPKKEHISYLCFNKLQFVLKIKCFLSSCLKGHQT